MELTDRQHDIVEASLELIARHGIQELTIKNLSRLVGISEPALYRHFKCKNEMLAALLSYFGDKNEEVFKRIAVSNVSALEKLQNVFEHQFRNFTDKPSISAVLFSEEIFRNDGDLSKKMFQMMQMASTYVLSFVNEGQASRQIRSDIPADAIGAILIGSLRLLVTKWRLSGFSFDLMAHGGELWRALATLVQA